MQKDNQSKTKAKVVVNKKADLLQSQMSSQITNEYFYISYFCAS